MRTQLRVNLRSFTASIPLPALPFHRYLHNCESSAKDSIESGRVLQIRKGKAAIAS
jgi:hypothetical protein